MESLTNKQGLQTMRQNSEQPNQMTNCKTFAECKENATAEQPEFEGSEIFQQNTCDKCGRKWVTVFSYQADYDLDGKELERAN